LPVFGFELFTGIPGQVITGSAEAVILPISYQLGPGDHLGIYLLGNVQKNMDVIVNVEGKVFLPPAGVIDVWGLTIQEFKQLLQRKLAQYYDNFSVDVMLLQPKAVAVAVVGDVNRPGKYVLSALNTVLDAVITASGPTLQGSIRNIQLIRNNELFASVDLYQFLMRGENEQDLFLQTGDRILVPLAESKVRVTGEINRPSVFELKPGADEHLSDLIDIAGGFTEFAYIDRIEISRLQENGHRRLVYVDYSRIKPVSSILFHRQV